VQKVAKKKNSKTHNQNKNKNNESMLHRHWQWQWQLLLMLMWQWLLLLLLLLLLLMLLVWQWQWQCQEAPGARGDGLEPPQVKVLQPPLAELKTVGHQENNLPKTAENSRKQPKIPWKCHEKQSKTARNTTKTSENKQKQSKTSENTAKMLW
jgi:hypothetical protein